MSSRQTIRQGDRTWTYFRTASGAPGPRAGWYDENGNRATASQALYLADLYRARHPVHPTLERTSTMTTTPHNTFETRCLRCGRDLNANGIDEDGAGNCQMDDPATGRTDWETPHTTTLIVHAPSSEAVWDGDEYHAACEPDGTEPVTTTNSPDDVTCPDCKQGPWMPSSPCKECDNPIDPDDGRSGYGMCSECLHDALRSGWDPEAGE